MAASERGQIDRFPPGVEEHLKWYVYRLIDPRDGMTFYVGKGRGDRIFDHARGTLSKDNDEDSEDLKVRQINQIRAAGLDVVHVVHRHGIETQEIAFQIEAALIDAYPGLTNRVSGHGSDYYGCRHVLQIIADYAAQPFEAREPLILISIAKSLEQEGRDVYESARGVWKIDVKRAKNYRLVLAHVRGVVQGAFRPADDWLPATKANFPWLDEDIPGRFGFRGDPAEQPVAELYVRKRVPDQYRKKGAANPIRFVPPAP